MTPSDSRGRFLLLVLLWLYGATGIAFAVWGTLGRGAAPDSTFALPLPEWVFWSAAGVNLAIATGGALRLPATRPVALTLHAGVAAVAATLLVLRIGDASESRCREVLELTAKGAVHAALFCYWQCSRAVSARLSRSA